MESMNLRMQRKYLHYQQATIKTATAQEWQEANRKKGFVNEQTINYITKYVTKVDLDHKEYKPLILCSKGIGKKYITSTNSENTKFNNDKTKDYYTTRSGHKIALPTYYRNSLYTEEEREKLWLYKLDQETRY